MKLLVVALFAVMISVSLVGSTYAAPSQSVQVKHDKKKHDKKHKKVKK